MKAKELMIGDYINSSFGVCHVISIDKAGVTLVNKEKEEFDYDYLDEDYWIQGIPLTAEILEKNGFEKDIVSGDTYFTLDDIVLQNDFEFGFDFGRFYRDSEDGFVLVGIITIKYVHELQRALRLCNIDKEIVL